MDKRNVGTMGVSLILLLGSAPAVLLAHEGHDHGTPRQGVYQDERQDTRRYDSRRNNDQGDERDEEVETYRSSRRTPLPDREYPAPRPREERSRLW